MLARNLILPTAKKEVTFTFQAFQDALEKSSTLKGLGRDLLGKHAKYKLKDLEQLIVRECGLTFDEFKIKKIKECPNLEELIANHFIDKLKSIFNYREVESVIREIYNNQPYFQIEIEIRLKRQGFILADLVAMIEKTSLNLKEFAQQINMDADKFEEYLKHVYGKTFCQIKNAELDDKALAEKYLPVFNEKGYFGIQRYLEIAWGPKWAEKFDKLTANHPQRKVSQRQPITDESFPHIPYIGDAELRRKIQTIKLCQLIQELGDISTPIFHKYILYRFKKKSVEIECEPFENINKEMLVNLIKAHDFETLVTMLGTKEIILKQVVKAKTGYHYGQIKLYNFTREEFLKYFDEAGCTGKDFYDRYHINKTEYLRPYLLAYFPNVDYSHKTIPELVELIRSQTTLRAPSLPILASKQPTLFLALPTNREKSPEESIVEVSNDENICYELDPEANNHPVLTFEKALEDKPVGLWVEEDNDLGSRFFELKRSAEEAIDEDIRLNKRPTLSM